MSDKYPYSTHTGGAMRHMNTVIIMHNKKQEYIEEYTEGDSLVEVFRFNAGTPACGNMLRLLAIIFEQLNIPNPTADWAQEYQRHNRALNTGDVVIIGEQAWACDMWEWRPLSRIAHA